MWIAVEQATLGLLFVSGATGKLLSLGPVAQSVQGRRLKSGRSGYVAAAGLVTVESMVAVALVTGQARVATLLVGSVLLLSFAGIESRRVRRGEAGLCGCLGDLVALRVDRFRAAVNLGLALSALVAALVTLIAPQAARPLVGLPATEAGIVWACAALLVGVYWLGAYSRTVLLRTSERIES
jgi:Methylamine utilisation protein MauE